MKSHKHFKLIEAFHMSHYITEQNWRWRWCIYIFFLSYSIVFRIRFFFVNWLNCKKSAAVNSSNSSHTMNRKKTNKLFFLPWKFVSDIFLHCWYFVYKGALNGQEMDSLCINDRCLDRVKRFIKKNISKLN